MTEPPIASATLEFSFSDEEKDPRHARFGALSHKKADAKRLIGESLDQSSKYRSATPKPSDVFDIHSDKPVAQKHPFAASFLIIAT